MGWLFRVGHAGWLGGQSRVPDFVGGSGRLLYPSPQVRLQGTVGWGRLIRFAVTGRLNRLLLVVIVVGVGVIVLAILTT